MVVSSSVYGRLEVDGEQYRRRVGWVVMDKSIVGVTG